MNMSLQNSILCNRHWGRTQAISPKPEHFFQGAANTLGFNGSYKSQNTQYSNDDGVDTLASLKSRGEANFYPGAASRLFYLCVYCTAEPSAARSYSSLFLRELSYCCLQVLQGIQESLGSCPQPLTEPTTCNMDADDNEAKVPRSSRRKEVPQENTQDTTTFQHYSF